MGVYSRGVLSRCFSAAAATPLSSLPLLLLLLLLLFASSSSWFSPSYLQACREAANWTLVGRHVRLICRCFFPFLCVFFAHPSILESVFLFFFFSFFFSSSNCSGGGKSIGRAPVIGVLKRAELQPSGARDNKCSPSNCKHMASAGVNITTRAEPVKFIDRHADSTHVWKLS